MNCFRKLVLFALFVQCGIAIRCDFRYIEDGESYPANIVDALVERLFAIDTHFASATPFVCEDKDSDGIGTSLQEFQNCTTNRFDDGESESLCSTSKRTIRPKALPSARNNDLLTVINQGEFSQTVTIEECEEPNMPCKFDENFPLGYKTKCKQNHQTHTLKVLNADKTAIIDEAIYYPSGCDCKVFPPKKS